MTAALTRFAASMLALLLAWLLMALLVTPGRSDWKNVADEREGYSLSDRDRAWFDHAHSKRSGTVSCCSLADGHRTTWTRHPGDSHYWVTILGEEYQVPDDAIIDAPSPIGEAVVWYRLDNMKPWIRCFSPGNGA